MIDLHFCHPSKAPPDIPCLHIQAYPPPFVVQLTAGRHIPELQPQGHERDLMRRLVADRKAGGSPDPLVFAAYEASYKARALDLADRCRQCLESLQDDQQSPVTGSAAIFCTCSVSEAAAGRCHRAWAAQTLATVPGFRVWLDGVGVRA